MAAFAAEKAQNYAEALRLWRKIDAADDAVAMALPLDFPWRSVVIGKHVGDLARSREYIANHYRLGLGIPKDYHEAVAWYTKALNTYFCGHGPSLWVYINLGGLYLYGLGVQADRVKAGELFTQAGPPGRSMNRLMDANMLPKSMDDWPHFNVDAAITRLNAMESNQGATQPLNPSSGSRP